MEWEKLKAYFDTEEKALKTARIVAATESRLASEPGGPQYEVETKVEKEEDKWQVYWRKIFIGFKSGCAGGCKSCQEKPPEPTKGKGMGKVLPFKKPSE